MSNTMDKEKILSKAKIGLMSKKNATFVSTIVLSLEASYSDEYVAPDGRSCPNPTACTDGVKLVLNEKWFTSQQPLEQIGLLAHEGYHVALQHTLPARRGNRDPGVWNQAADHFINNMITAEGFRIPKGGLCDPQYKDLSTEQIYEILMKDPSKQDPNFTPDFATGPGPNDPAAQQAHANQVTSTLTRAATQAQMAGDSASSIPGDILIELHKLLYPKLPWFIILHDFFNGMANDDYTYAKPNRKFLPYFYLPTLFAEGMGTFACAVDTSGSVSDHDFMAFATEMNAAKEELNPEKMYVIDFDTQVNSIYEIGEADDVQQLKFKGRGGTDLRPVFEHFAKKPPHVLVIFSDLECEPIEKNPGYPVVWIRTPGHGHTPSFGKLIEFDPD